MHCISWPVSILSRCELRRTLEASWHMGLPGRSEPQCGHGSRKSVASRVGRDQWKRTGLHFFQQELESRADRLFLQRIVESDRHDAIAGLRAKAYMRCQHNRSVVEHLFPINSL